MSDRTAQLLEQLIEGVAESNLRLMRLVEEVVTTNELLTKIESAQPNPLDTPE